MKIKLSKNLILTNDKRQFILNKVKQAKEDKYDEDDNLIIKKGDDILFPISYYSNLESLLKCIPDKVILNSSIQNIADLINIYKKMTKKLLDIPMELKDDCPLQKTFKRRKINDYKIKRRK